MKVQLQGNTVNISAGGTSSSSSNSSSISGNLLLLSYMFISINCIFINFRHIHKIAKKWLLALLCLLICPSVRPSIRVEQLSCYWMDFHEFWYLNIFRKSVEKFQVSFKSDNNSGCFTWKRKYIYDILLNSYYTEKCFRQKLYRKSKHTFFVQELISKNHAVHEIMWKNIVEADKPQMIV